MHQDKITREIENASAHLRYVRVSLDENLLESDVLIYSEKTTPMTSFLPLFHLEIVCAIHFYHAHMAFIVFPPHIGLMRELDKRTN